MRIAVVAPSCTLSEVAAERVAAIVAARGGAELVVHPQCFASDRHFAGDDATRLAALRRVMADPAVDAIWFARGGYGSNRIAEAAPESVTGGVGTGVSTGFDKNQVAPIPAIRIIMATARICISEKIKLI